MPYGYRDREIPRGLIAANALTSGLSRFLEVLGVQKEQEKAEDLANRKRVYDERMKVFGDVEANDRWEKGYALDVANAKALEEYRDAILNQKSAPDVPSTIEGWITGEVAGGRMDLPAAAKAMELFHDAKTTPKEPKTPPDLGAEFVSGYGKQYDDWQRDKKAYEDNDLFGERAYDVPAPSASAYFDAVIRPRAATFNLPADSIRMNLSGYYPELANKAAPTQAPAAGGGLTAEEEDAANKMRKWIAANPGRQFNWDAAQKDFPNLRMDQIKALLTP
jgi:hypothetical protein